MQDIHSSVLPGKTERTPWQYIQVYKYRWAGRLCWSLTARAWRDYKPLEARRLRLIYCLGEGGGRSFVATKELLLYPPLKHTVWFWPPPPTLAVKDFMIPPLLSQLPQKASVTICKQVTPILILTSYEPWTTTSHIWSSDMNWIVCEG